MSAERRNIMLGTAGHVDHGKTALVKLLTGCETDTLAEEKQRGLTIDLGFAPCRLADKRVVGIVDVPGHVDFIRNMVAGAHGIDVVILVVAADDGIMPQTHEHLHILTLMGLKHGVVALTKTDLVDPVRREFVGREVRRLLVGTFLAKAPICPISNVTGEGFGEFFQALNQEVGACENRRCSGMFRLWVEDAFSIRGAGTVITGVPTNGLVRSGDHLYLLPLGLAGHVRRMQVYGEDATEGRAGECVALNIPEMDHEIVRRGMVLSQSDAVEPVTIAEAEFRILDSIQTTIEDYLQVQLHVGTAAVSAHLAMLETREMRGGQNQVIQLRLTEALALAPGERFVVRANLSKGGLSGVTTIGGGRILGVSNSRLPRKKQWAIDALTHRREALDDPARWCELMVRQSAQPMSIGTLRQKCEMRMEEVMAIVERLKAEGRISRVSSGAYVHVEKLREAAVQILTAVKAFHANNPRRAGIGREELLQAVKADGELLDLALESLIQDKRLERSGAFFAWPGHGTPLSNQDQRLCDQLAEALQKAGWAPPSPEELSAALAVPLLRVGDMVRLLTERGILVRLDERVSMHREAVDAGRQTALKLFRSAPSFTTMAFRDALGVSRKFAVPLLDHLDKTRFTVRSGHNRTPGAEAKKRLKPAETGVTGSDQI